MSSLDEFLQNPQLAMAAGLLSPTPNASFGGGLSQGLQAMNLQRAANTRDSFVNQETLLSQQRVLEAQRQAQDRARFQKGLGGLQQKRALQGPTRNNAPLTSTLTALQEDPNKAVTSLLSSVSTPQQLNSVVGLLNTLTPASAQLPTKASLALRAAQGDKTAESALKRMKSTEKKTFSEQFALPLLQKVQSGKALTKPEQTAWDMYSKVGFIEALLRGSMSVPPPSNEDTLLGQARDALNSGKINRGKAERILKENGVDPGKL